MRRGWQQLYLRYEITWVLRSQSQGGPLSIEMAMPVAMRSRRTDSDR